ncbi:MAG: hypothetical protein J5766_00065 [Clostridia bacterium]|nr:hypothetical protein [Clostridia bacterium]
MNNNQKVLIAIISGSVVVLVAAIILLLKLGVIDFSGSNKDETSKTTTSQAADKTKNSGKTEDADGKDTSSDSGSNAATVDTGKKTVDVENVVASTSSDEVVIPIYATKNPGFIAARLFITFDTNAFSFADCEGGDICESMAGEFSNGKLTVVAQTDGDPESLKCVSGAGVIGKIILKPKKDAKPGEYTINISEDSEFANLGDKLIPKGDIKVEAGKVILK